MMAGQFAGRLDLGGEVAVVSDRLSYGALSYDQAFANLEELIAWYADKAGTRNEATTRKHLVDKILFGCLGWQDTDVVLEDHTTHISYTDYTFSLTRPALIVEAKKEGTYFEFPVGRYSTLSIEALKRDSQVMGAAIDQVSRYCYAKGVQFAAVTNGHQLLVFAAQRFDGVAPDKGAAIVFDSLESMRTRFLTLWNVMSRDSVAEGRIKLELIGGNPVSLPAKLSRSIADYPGNKGRNPFQADLKEVSEYVLEDLTRVREYEEQFLEECYSESGALAQYSLLGRTILRSRYHGFTDTRSPGPTLTQTDDDRSDELLAPSVPSTRPILLVGDVGVGKTTFIKHLIYTQDADFRSNSIVLYIDLGSSQSLTLDPRQSILTDLQDQLRDNYSIDIDDDVFVRDVYRGDLVRFGRSPQGRYRAIDPTAFLKREIHFLEQKLEARERHLKASLENIVNARRKTVVVILDNCDQRPEGMQEVAFLISEEMANHWPATVFLALRPETFHASRRRGALTGYHSRAFAIAPPRVDDVIHKRLDYALKISRGQIAIGAGGNFGQFANLETLLEVFVSSLNENVRLFECIENISGGNVRFALDLIKTFFGSGHINTRKIVDLQRLSSSSSYTIPLHEFLRAIIHSDNVYYDPSESPVVNMFDLSSQDPREHFLLPAMLSVLHLTSDEHVERGFVSAAQVYERLEGCGFTSDQIDYAAIRAVRKKLIETAARRIPEAGAAGAPSMRITSVGRYHYMRLTRQFTYYDAIVVDTPILAAPFRSNIGTAATIFDRVDRCEHFSSYLDDCWRSVSEETSQYFDWPTTLRDLAYNISQVRRSATRTATQ